PSQVSFEFGQVGSVSRRQVLIDGTVARVRGVPPSTCCCWLATTSASDQLPKEKAGCWTRRRGVCPGQAQFEYPATSVLFSSCVLATRAGSWQLVQPGAGQHVLGGAGLRICPHEVDEGRSRDLR